MRSLGKYEILSELGRGGMAVVYKARDPFINRLVALKTISTDLSGSSSLLDRFYQEARSAGTLQHPNIVTIYELGEQTGAPFIAMEYIEGETLERLISRKADIPIVVKLGYIVRVSEGLRYAHDHGVIHRDIKPANVMVTNSGLVKVVDFGIARVMDVSMTQANLVMGSRAYMAPQLYEGQRADARSDIWALGVTLYELLAQRKPFAGDSEAELMFKILRDDPAPLRSLCPDCPDALEEIVRRMLEKSVTTRYQSMEELLPDLRSVWEQAQQEAVQPLLQQARKLIEARDYRPAQEVLRRAAQIDDADMPVKSMLDQVSREVRRLDILPRVQEHVNRGRAHLQSGKLAEARSEMESALSLDTRSESAQQLRKELEEATKRAEQVDQCVKIVKQRLLGGALTEAMQALQQVSDLAGTDGRVQELKKQITEEQERREKRERLSRLTQQARGLWMESKYSECLAVVAEGLKEFPNDAELLKLREQAKLDWAEEEKQQRLAQARKHLGQQQFAEAREILERLAKQYAQDSSVKKLMALVQQGEEEKRKRERLDSELVKLRTLVREEKYEAAQSTGDALLREYPEEFELKELVGYARAELAQQRLKQRQQGLENQIQELLRARRYAEAAAAAQRAMHEFSAHHAFRKLWEEAEAQNREQQQREEYQRRIQEIQRRISRQELTDAIDLAHQTLATMGEHQGVSQLLRMASAEREEKNRRLEQQTLNAARTLVEAGKSDEAARVLNNAFATQILQPSHAEAKDLLTQIQSLPRVPEVAPRQTGNARPANPQPLEPLPSSSSSSLFSATSVLSQTPPPVAPVSAPPAVEPLEEKQAMAAAVGGGVMQSTGVSAPPARDVSPRVATPKPLRRKEAVPSEKKKELGGFAGQLQHQLAMVAVFLKQQSVAVVAALKRSLSPTEPALRRRVLLIGGIAIAAVALTSAGIVVWRIFGQGRLQSAENQLRGEAQQLWNQGQPDQSEEKWKEIVALHGGMEKEATQQIASIEEQRREEQHLFDEGQALLQKDPNDARGRQDLQQLVGTRLWHAADAEGLVASLGQPTPAPADLIQKEQDLFGQGEQFFAGGKYDDARRSFRDVVNLNVPNSALLPKAQEYLRKIRSSNDDKKNFDAAMEDFQNENWGAAKDGFQTIVERKGALKNDAQKQLEKIALAQAAIKGVEEQINSHNYRAAKSKIDGMQQWPKSSALLRQEASAAEATEFIALKTRAQSLLQKQDVTGLGHLQDDLQLFSSREQDSATQKAAADLDRNLTAEIADLQKNLSGDKTAFEKAEKDFQEARSAGDINRLSTEVSREFDLIAKGTGYNHVAAQQYVSSVIPSAVKDIAQSIATRGKAAVPPISCNSAQIIAPGQEGSGQTASCADLGLHWVGNPTVDVPPAMKQAGKPNTLSVIIFVDGNGKVSRIDKDGAVDAEFFKKAKDAAKEWKASAPMLNGKPTKVSFPMQITFEP